MKLTVSKEEMQGKLAKIQGVVEKRNTMPILSHFLLNAGKDKSYIIATDLETAIKEPVTMTVEKEGALSIPAKKLLEIVREVEGDIHLWSDDEQWLKVEAGASRFRLACLAAKDFPVWPGIEAEEELQIEASSLQELIEKTIYAAGEADTRYTLNGLLFHVKSGESRITVVGTDGHRLALIQGSTGTAMKEEKKVIVPRKSVMELKKSLESDAGSVIMHMGNNLILFTIGDVQFFTRLIEGTYPSYEQVIPLNNDKKMTLNREALMRVLRRASIMSKEGSNAVKMEVDKGVLAVSSSNPDMGEAKDEMNVEYEGSALTIGLNARYLLDALNAMSSEKTVFELNDSLSPVLLKEEGMDNYKGVIMPIRI